MKNNFDRKMFYILVTCLVLSVIIIGATFAFFTASASDDSVVIGNTAASSFGMSVSKVTSLDMTFGLVPMKNTEAPYAAEQLCYDDNNSVGCQIYKITLYGDSSDVMFVDGYITTDVISGIETRFTRVYPYDYTYEDPTTHEEVTEHIFRTSYTKEEMLDVNFDMDEHIKSGQIGSLDTNSLNRTDDYNCLFASDEMIGGTAGDSVDLYLMIWIWDDGTNQDFIQGAQIVYTGTATFISSQGNEIKATFD